MKVLIRVLKVPLRIHRYVCTLLKWQSASGFIESGKSVRRLRKGAAQLLSARRHEVGSENLMLSSPLLIFRPIAISSTGELFALNCLAKSG